MCHISEERFRTDVTRIYEISGKLKDDWELHSVGESVYLRKRQTVLLKTTRQIAKQTEEEGDSEDALVEDVDSACLTDSVCHRVSTLVFASGGILDWSVGGKPGNAQLLTTNVFPLVFCPCYV